MSSPDTIRLKILEAALKIAPFEGWNDLSLRRAVRDAKLPDGAGALYFEDGLSELLDFWSNQLDAQAALKIAALDLPNLKIRDRVTQAVTLRLELLTPHEEAARRASARLVLPDMAMVGTAQIWRSADMIWTAIGDRSTDGNYYSKRMILSAVLAATLPVWLSDTDEDKETAKRFLDARIANVMQFETFKWKAREATQNWPNPAEVLGQLRYGGLESFMRPRKGRARRRYAR